MPSLAPGATTTNEDTSVNVGSQITYAATDTDGSEHVTSIVISGIPNGSTVNAVGVGSATATYNAGAGLLTITASNPDPALAADIRATLNGFALTPPLHVGNDIPLGVQVTVTMLMAVPTANPEPIRSMSFLWPTSQPLLVEPTRPTKTQVFPWQGLLVPWWTSTVLKH